MFPIHKNVTKCYLKKRYLGAYIGAHLQKELRKSLFFCRFYSVAPDRAKKTGFIYSEKYLCTGVKKSSYNVRLKHMWYGPYYRGMTNLISKKKGFLWNVAPSY